jgi:hypothetical protein
VMQVFDAMNLSLSSKTNEISTASFDIPLYQRNGSIHPSLVNIATLAKMNRVKIAMNISWVESTQFDGYISSISDGPTSTKVTLSDYLGVLESRIITADITFTGVSVSSILTSLFATMNATDPTGISVTSSIADLVTKTYTAGQSLMDIVQDLAQGGYQYIMRGLVFAMDTTVWVDRSTGSSYIEFRYDYREARSRNISDFTMDSNVKNIQNAISAKPTTGALVNASDATSISTYGRREEMISANGTLATEVAKYLAEHKDDTTEISITPTTYDYSLANSGDIVKVTIDRGDARGKYSGTMRIVSKEYTTQGDLPSVIFSLSSSKIRTPNILEVLKAMNDDIKNLKTL